MRRRRGGLALATVLLVVFIVLLFALTLAGLASSRYQMAVHSSARARAFEAAQAGLAAAIARLCQDPSWGGHGEVLSQALEGDGMGYTVTFDRTGPGPWSVNNLRSEARAAGYQGRAVPPHAALLLSRAGRPGDPPERWRTVEALVQFKPFPYAIASDRYVRATFPALLVGGATSLDDLLSGNTSVAGHVYGGAPAAGSVAIGPAGVVTGKVVTPGTASMSLGAVAMEGVENGAEPETMPDIDLSRYDNQGWAETVEMAPGTYGTPQTLSGVLHVAGDLELQTGAAMQDAYLYVDGDLVCDGPLTGTGTVFATGGIRLAAAANLVVTNGIAVFSGGDLEVRPVLPVGLQFFQGVLYSRSTVRIRSNVQVVGAILGLGDVTLDGQTTVIYLSDYTQFGSAWEAAGMRGSVVNGDTPRMRVLFWRESPP